MSQTLKSLGIDKWCVAERIALIGDIWDSVADEAETLPLSDAQKNEIDRRLANHASAPQEAVSWEQVQAEALARLRK